MNNNFGIESDAIINAAALIYPSISHALIYKLRVELKSPKSAWLPNVLYANTEELGGFLGEYRPKTNTIILNSDEFSPSTNNAAKNYVLAHELGHFLEQLTPEIAETHDQTNLFAQEITGSKPDFSAYSNYLGIQKSREDGSQGFDTGYHSGMSFAALEQLGVKDEVLKGNPKDLGSYWASDVMRNGEGEIYAGNWDSDRFNTKDLGAGLSGLGEIIKQQVGQSSFGLQMDSSSHFDENDFEGGFATQAHRRQSAINSFFDTDIAANNSGFGIFHNPLANPKFSGSDAGVSNYLYRFGQVLHALQDFYSHSTFVNLAYIDNNKWGLQDKIIDNTWDFGKLYRKGDVFAGNVVIAKHGPVTYSGLGTSKVVGRVGWSLTSPLSREDVYWKVVSKGQTTFKTGDANQYLSAGYGEVYSETDTGKLIAGLMTGSVSPNVYYTKSSSDLQTYIPLFDASQKAWNDDGFFRGLSHGGLAGNSTGFWVAPLSKDKNESLYGKSTNELIKQYSNSNFTANTKIDQFLSLQANAQLFAVKQTLHEWDRFAVLLYNTWESKTAGKGKQALEKLASYSIKAGNTSQFVDRIINLANDIKSGKSNSTYLSSIKFPSYDPEGSTTSDLNNWSSLKFTLEESVDYNPVSNEDSDRTEGSENTELPRRRIRLFNTTRPDSITLESINLLADNSVIVDQIYLDETKSWAIANNIIDAHSENEEIVTPLDYDYLKEGLRASWTEIGPDGRIIRFFDKQNSDKSIVIDDFDIENEVLGIFDKSNNTYEIVSNITLADFDQERKKLYQEYNVYVDAQAIKKSAELKHTVTTEQIRKAIEESGFYAIKASSFFLDPDTEGDTSHSYHQLLFTGYLEQYSWIKLVDGQLIIDSIDGLPLSGDFQISAPIADGNTSNYSDLIQIILNPSLTESEVKLTIDTNSILNFESNYIKGNAWTLAYQVINDEGAVESDFVQLFGRSGIASGSVNGLDETKGSYNFSNLATVGNIKFYLVDTKTEVRSELELTKLPNESYQLLFDNESIANFNLSSDPSDVTLTPVQHTTLKGDLLGYYLPESDQFALNSGSTIYTVSGTIYSEAENSNTIGFALVNNDTGEFIDPLTGSVYSSIDYFSSSKNANNNFNNFYSSTSLHQQKVLKNTPTEFSFNFKLDNSLVSSRYTIMPFLQSKDEDGLSTFTSGIFDNHESNHAALIGGGIGFEDQLKLGDGDFDDAIVVIDQINQA